MTKTETDNERETSSYTGKLWWVLATLTVLVLAEQTRYLFTYPVPDTGMWFGDESWTMLTVRAMARTGVACVPEALGSSLAHSNGFVNGSIWITGLLYGVPANLFAASASPIAIGRLLTLLLSLAMLAVVYRLSRRIGASALASMTALFALVLSDGFCFASHSARLDAATGLAIVLYLLLLVSILQHHLEHATTIRRGMDLLHCLLISFLATISLAVYVHVPTLIALPALYAFWKLDAWRDWRKLTSVILGFVFGLGILLLIYRLTSGSIDLLGSGYNQYYNVANSLPILHLRSWRVQKINTIDRAIQLWQVAWPLVSAFILGLAFVLWKRPRVSALEGIFYVLTALVTLSWGLAEGPAVFYNIHFLPMLAVCTALLLNRLFESISFHAQTLQLCLAIAVLLSMYTIVNQERHGYVGKRLVTENRNAIAGLLSAPASLNTPPLVLTDQPGLNDVANTPGIRLMTNHLLLFGNENLPLADILREKRVNYLLLYSTRQWQSPFRRIADSLYTLVDQRVGPLTDQARTYDAPAWNEMDTLRLYKAQ